MEFEQINSSASADQLREAAREISAALAGAGETLPAVERPDPSKFTGRDRELADAEGARTAYLLSLPSGKLSADMQAELILGLQAWSRAGKP